MICGLLGLSRYKRGMKYMKIIRFAPVVCEYTRSGVLYDDDLWRPNRFRIYSDGRVTVLVGKEDEFQGCNVSIHTISILTSLIRRWKVYSLPERLGSLFYNGFDEEIAFFDERGQKAVNIRGGDPYYIGFHKLADYIYEEIIKPNQKDDVIYKEYLRYS